MIGSTLPESWGAGSGQARWVVSLWPPQEAEDHGCLHSGPPAHLTVLRSWVESGSLSSVPPTPPAAHVACPQAASAWAVLGLGLRLRLVWGPVRRAEGTWPPAQLRPGPQGQRGGPSTPEAFPAVLVPRGPSSTQLHPQRQAPVPARPAPPSPHHPGPPPTGQAGESQPGEGPPPPQLGHQRRYRASCALHPHSLALLTGVTRHFQAHLTAAPAHWPR